MVPPEGMGVAGVKASVMGTGDLQATRSDDAMLKNNEEAAVMGKMKNATRAHVVDICMRICFNSNRVHHMERKTFRKESCRLETSRKIIPCRERDTCPGQMVVIN